MTFRIFVSHSADDGELIDTIRLHTEAMGVEAYFYDRDLQPGREVSQKLQEAIRRSDAVLAVLTESSATSAYVHQEIGYAIGQGKAVLPLISPTGNRPAMAMLEGHEYLTLDPTVPEPGTAALVKALHKGQQSKSQHELIVTLVLIALIVLLFWSAPTGRS